MENNLLAGGGVIAVIVVWLVFSLLKKLIGLALLAALAVGAWLVWSNPDLLAGLVNAF